jgi:hypothetical protein
MKFDIRFQKHKQIIYNKSVKESGCWWVMPVILATQEAEMRRIVV